MKLEINWARPELLQDADTWAAYTTVMEILCERGQTPTTAAIAAEAAVARSWALNQSNHVCDRWAPAYARVRSALDL